MTKDIYLEFCGAFVKIVYVLTLLGIAFTFDLFSVPEKTDFSILMFSVVFIVCSVIHAEL